MVMCVMPEEKKPHPNKGRKQSPEHIAKRMAAVAAARLEGRKSGWPQGTGRTDAEKLAISKGLLVSPSVDARRVWLVCNECGDPFRSGGNPRQQHCSRTCYNVVLARESKYLNSAGYVNKTYDGVSRLEHRVVMEQMLGRALEAYETVHHKNGDRQDNRPQNLELWASRQPKGQRVEDLVEHAKWVLARYESFTTAITQS